MKNTANYVPTSDFSAWIKKTSKKVILGHTPTENREFWDPLIRSYTSPDD